MLPCFIRFLKIIIDILLDEQINLFFHHLYIITYFILHNVIKLGLWCILCELEINLLLEIE